MKLLKLIGNFLLSFVLAILLIAEAGFISYGVGLAMVWCIIFLIVTTPLRALGVQLGESQAAWMTTGILYFLFWLLTIYTMWENKKEEASAAV